jgi:hypothetical protein
MDGLSKKSVLRRLYQVPKKDKGLNMPHIDVLEPGYTHQADLLFLPHDGDYRYALVVVDTATGLTDAEPLKSKKSEEVLKAFKKIYKRGPLEEPHRLEMDAGTEFKGAVKQYFEDQDVYIRVGQPNRHRQQALAERRNQTIGKTLMMRMTAQELLTGEPSVEWVEDLPKVIEAINKKMGKKKKKKYPDEPVCEGDSCNLLDEGTKVRVALDEPISAVTARRLPGKFRSGDIRWNPKVRTIEFISLRPGQPPMYMLNGGEPIAYTRNQLQVVHEDEEPPDTNVIRGNPEHYIVEKILEKKKVKGKIMFLIKWYGFKEKTWEPRSEIIKDVPDMVKEFEG